MNLNDLIHSYEKNRNHIYMTSYPIWVKKYLLIIYFLVAALFVVMFAFDKLNGFLFLGIVLMLVVILIYFLRKLSQHLFKKYNGRYGLELTNKNRWTEASSNIIRKEEIKNILGNHVANESLMNRIKAQLQSEILTHTKSLQIGVPVTGFINLLIGAYLGFNIQYFQAVFKEHPEVAFEKGKLFFVKISVLIIVWLFIVIAYKPLIELLLNQYSKRLTNLLRTIETIEIEYLSTKTEKQIEA